MSSLLPRRALASARLHLCVISASKCVSRVAPCITKASSSNHDEFTAGASARRDKERRNRKDDDDAERVRDKILGHAMEYVVELGWTREAISQASEVAKSNTSIEADGCNSSGVFTNKV